MTNPNGVKAAFSLGDIAKAADPTQYVPGGNSNNSGDGLVNPGNAVGGTVGNIINDVLNPGGQIGNNGYGTPGDPQPPRPGNPLSSTDAAMQALLAKNQAAATSLSQYATDFGNEMPGYEGAEYNNLTGHAKSALTNDIYNVNADANSRGLLHSGIRAGNQANAAATESSKLASGIQTANSKAHSQLDQANQNAANAQSIVDGERTAYGGLQGSMTADQYSTAIQELGNQNQFLGGLIGGMSKGAGAAAAAIFA